MGLRLWLAFWKIWSWAKKPKLVESGHISPAIFSNQYWIRISWTGVSLLSGLTCSRSCVRESFWQPANRNEGRLDGFTMLDLAKASIWITYESWSPSLLTRARWSSMRPQAAYIFVFHSFSLHSIFQFSYFFLLITPSSSSLLPPCPSFLLVPPSSSSLLVQHCLNHLKSVKVHFPLILTKALPTDRRRDQPTDQPTDNPSYRDADASKNDVNDS